MPGGDVTRESSEGAQECSPRRKPWVRVENKETSPKGAKETAARAVSKAKALLKPFPRLHLARCHPDCSNGIGPLKSRSGVEGTLPLSKAAACLHRTDEAAKESTAHGASHW